MSRSLALLVSGIMAAFFGCFFAYPIWTTVKLAFETPDHRFTLEFVCEVFMNTLYREGLINSFVIAIWTTLGCLLISLPLAVLFVRYTFPGKTLLNSLVLTPLVLPPFVGAIGIKAILGQAGSLNALLIDLGLMNAQHPTDWLGEGQMLGIVIMEVLHLYPILYLNVAAALANLDPAMEEAAANLGCSPLQRFWRVTLPLIMPGIFAGGTLVFIWAFTELGVPLVFDYDRVTSVQIFRSLNDLSDNPFPYALVVVMLVFSTLIYLVGKVFFGRADATGGGRATTGRETLRLPLGLGWLCTLVFALVTFVAVLPHLGVVMLSFADDWYGTVLPQAFTLDHYQEALGHEITLSAIANSLKYSVIAILFALLLGIGVAYVNVRTRIWGRQLLDAMAMLPLAVPGVVLAFGYLAMTRPGQYFDWLILDENPVLILVIAYAVRRLPFIVRSASAGFQQVSPTLEEAAQNLGATPERALWRITLPLVAPHLLAGALLAFAFAMLEVSDSMILAQQAAHFPITKAIYFLVMALGNGPSLASALGVWAMIFLTITITGAALLLGKKLGALFR
ncbi:iron(III) transport system permease protein [Prosthecobacter fusiformis]|uniref:Iron(III) transport system permease protein n=1 Tax=Prosthecobacter fusiformis TaxID=48464 RepID=A0A4R7RK51_9BACT|nr:iron ABC transporter permease [Prosthecobacter fusiformis]TDU63195.1 iron(III) transport system permease protein [Prosthecobacter fusiformis]